MTNQEALEIGLVLAELESQLKARETPASPAEAGEMLREIMARHATEKQQKKPTEGFGKGKGLSAEKLKILVEERARERLEEAEEQRRINPHGVPIIFPG